MYRNLGHGLRLNKRAEIWIPEFHASFNSHAHSLVWDFRFVWHDKMTSLKPLFVYIQHESEADKLGLVIGFDGRRLQRRRRRKRSPVSVCPVELWVPLCEALLHDSPANQAEHARVLQIKIDAIHNDVCTRLPMQPTPWSFFVLFHSPSDLDTKLNLSRTQ